MSATVHAKTKEQESEFSKIICGTYTYLDTKIIESIVVGGSEDVREGLLKQFYPDFTQVELDFYMVQYRQAANLITQGNVTLDQAYEVFFEGCLKRIDTMNEAVK